MEEKSKFVDKIQNWLMPFANWISTNTYISSVGDGIQSILPAILVGAFAVLFANLSPAFWQNFVTSTGIKDILGLINTFTLGMIGLYGTAAVAYHFARKIKQEILPSVIFSVGAFLVLQGTDTGTISTAYFGASGLFLGMALGLLVPSIIRLMTDKGWYIKMPKGVPNVVENAFASITPGLVIFALAGVISYFLGKTEAGSITALFYTYLQKPFSSVGLSFWGFLIITLVSLLVFWMGIHGNTVLSIAIPIWIAANVENLEAYQAGLEIPNIISWDFFYYSVIGGAGATLGLVICMLIWSKSERLKTLTKIALVPSIFNINEPLLFGVPIMLNPIMLIPWLLMPTLIYIFAYLLTTGGVLPRLIGLSLSFTVPNPLFIFLSGGGWRGLLFALAMLVLSIAVYYPFFRIVDRRALAEEEAASLPEQSPTK